MSADKIEMNSILFNKLLHSLVINIFTDYLVKELFLHYKSKPLVQSKC